MKFKILALLSTLLVPSMVDAAVINEASTPEYDATKNVLIANGTPIVVEEVDGITYAKWGNEKIELNDDSIVVGGSVNPCSEKCTVDYQKTSITMNSGKVGYLVGGNLVTQNYELYDKIHVGEINIDVNGGTIKEISGVTMSNRFDVALSGSYYSKIHEYYYADKVNIDISNAIVTTRVYILSSYTYAKNVLVNVDKSTINKDYYGFAIGTNGEVGTYVANINDSTVEMIHSGFRTMVDSMTVNVTGSSNVGEIFAGTSYGVGERAIDTNNWQGWGLGGVNYGQVGKMEFNLGENVNYDNIFAGFQFVDLGKFKEVYRGNDALNTYAKGINGSDNAEVIINIASSPKVTNSVVDSMLKKTSSNVKINYITKEVDVPSIDTSKEVTKVEVGGSDATKINNILATEAKTNELVLEAVANGSAVEVALDIAISTPSEEVQTKIAEKVGNANLIPVYFDINVLIKDGNKVLGTIPQLGAEIPLTVALPHEYTSVKEGYNREYYIVREHEGKVELIDATLSKDGKFLNFSSDKFSTFAIAYRDVEKKEIINPQTGDSIVFILTLSIVGISGMALGIKTLKKEI